jgi:hemin uptake protein HemP
VEIRESSLDADRPNHPRCWVSPSRAESRALGYPGNTPPDRRSIILSGIVLTLVRISLYHANSRGVRTHVSADHKDMSEERPHESIRRAAAHPRVINSSDILHGQDAIRVLHGDTSYILRVTEGGKLYLNKPTPPVAGSRTSRDFSDARAVKSEDLLQGQREVQILHFGILYLLRLTKSGNLILHL